jgi:hypothetical protein
VVANNVEDLLSILWVFTDSGAPKVNGNLALGIEDVFDVFLNRHFSLLTSYTITDRVAVKLFVLVLEILDNESCFRAYPVG